MKKTIIIFIVLVVLAGGFYFYKRQAKAPSEEGSPAAQNSDIQTPSSTKGQDNTAASAQNSQQQKTPMQPQQTKPSTSTFSSGEEAEGLNPDVLVVEVKYDGSKFDPSSVDIKVGDVVVFKNTSSSSFWPVSKGGEYKDFDPSGAIPAAGKYTFQFTKAGNWDIMDKTNTSAAVVINVSR